MAPRHSAPQQPTRPRWRRVSWNSLPNGQDVRLSQNRDVPNPLRRQRRVSRLTGYRRTRSRSRPSRSAGPPSQPVQPASSPFRRRAPAMRAPQSDARIDSNGKRCGARRGTSGDHSHNGPTHRRRPQGSFMRSSVTGRKRSSVAGEIACTWRSTFPEDLRLPFPFDPYRNNGTAPLPSD